MPVRRCEPRPVPTALPVWHRVVGGLLAVAVAAAGAVLLALGTPSAPGGGHQHGAPGRSVTELVDPSTGPADVRIRLVARMARIALSTGQVVDGWTFGGTIPAPQITVHAGQLVEITVHNDDVAAGVTVHWHGLDVPNAMDGVAGVTQDAVPPGQEFVYRFRPRQVGTFWYHTHQDSAVGVAHGLFGALVVLPAAGDAADGAGTRGSVLDRVLLAHTWRAKGRPDVTTIGLEAGKAVGTVVPGTAVRLRLVNSDSLPQHWAIAGTDFAVTAIDGTDVHGPTPLHGATLTLGGGGRYDVSFVMPDRAVAVGLLDGNAPQQILVPPGGADAPELTGGPAFDPLAYGVPAPVPFTMATRYDVDATQKLETRRTFRGGIPTTYWTINGQRAPDVPMIMVDEGDAVRVHVINAGDTVHPMHLHGHRVLVLQRNGIPARGSPWWADTVNLDPGDDVWVAFVADNPGIWMDHCHNLDHAAAGMLMHVGYRGISTPYGTGGHNKPE